jgi:hypothetical protein
MQLVCNVRFTPKADIWDCEIHVRFPPKADMCVAQLMSALGQKRTSVELRRMFVDPSPLERGLPGSRRVDYHAHGLDDDWGVVDHDVVSRCVSVMCTAPGTSAASSFWAAEFARSTTAPKSGRVSGGSSPAWMSFGTTSMNLSLAVSTTTGMGLSAAAAAVWSRVSSNPAVPDPGRPRAPWLAGRTSKPTFEGDDLDAWQRAIGYIESVGSRIGTSAGEYEDHIPGILGVYFRWTVSRYLPLDGSLGFSRFAAMRSLLFQR